MDWRNEYETNRAVLYRIVAMLLAFAELAQRVDNLPHPFRWFAVRFLHPAAAVACEFVSGSTDSAEAMDALDLARTFRVLALALRNTLRRLRSQLSCCSVRAPSSLPLEGRVASRRLAGWGHLGSAGRERQLGAWP